MKNKQKEQRLNKLFSECFTMEEALDNLIYLTNKSRGKSTSESHIIKCYVNGTLGSLLKRLDLIAFYTN